MLSLKNLSPPPFIGTFFVHRQASSKPLQNLQKRQEKNGNNIKHKVQENHPATQTHIYMLPRVEPLLHQDK